jgi:putative exporter of polyketide antibiotics
MTHLVFTHLAFLFRGPDDIFGSFGLWVFLSIGAVSLFGIFLPITTWLDSRRKEREAFYKAETLRRVSEASGDAGKASIEFLREQNRVIQYRTIEGLKIGGLVMVGVGFGVLILLWFLTGPAVATCGLIPLFIGLAMLIYVRFLAAPIQ